jgi:O-glycosyl hydrolase
MSSVLHKSLGIFATLTLLWCAPTFAAVLNLTIDKNTRYQTIEGLGAYNGIPTLYRKAGDFFYLARPKDYEYDRMILDLGASGIRFDLPPQCFPEEGKSKNWGHYSPELQAMREYFKRDNTVRFIVSVWSPPCWMKDTRSCYNGGHLETSRYDDMAEYIGDFLKMVKDSVGVEIYAISPQNEPKFPEPYNSCIYEENQLLSLAKKTAAVIKSRNLKTKIFGAEDMFKRTPKQWQSFMSDDAIDAFAVHGYSDGVTEDKTITNGLWAAFRDTLANRGNKQFWMTETTTPTGDANAYTLVKNLFSALNYGNVSWWTWWSYSPQVIDAKKLPGELAATSPTIAYTYYRFKHFTRFIRPGAVRIKSSITDTSMLATAFQNSDSSYSIVLSMLNYSSGKLTINAPGLPTSGWKMYRTNNSDDNSKERCKFIGEFSLDQPITINNKKETITLTTMAYIPVLPADTTTPWLPAPPPSTKAGELNIHGDDSLELYVNGQLIDYDRVAKKVQVSLVGGKNIIAARLKNTDWGGGLIASMHLPNGDTLITDKSWKINYSQPEGDWKSLNYDDNNWKEPTELGPVLIWPNAAGWGLSPINFHYQKAKWISGATKTYFRKTITGVTAPLTAHFYGNNTHIKIFVNDQLLIETDSFAVAKEKVKPMISTINATGNVTIAIALKDVQAYNQNATKRGDGVLFKMMLLDGGLDKPVSFDTTWTFSVDSVANWTKPTFDDSQWLHPQRVGSFSEELNQTFYYYPTTFWFRKSFESTATGVLNINFINPRDRAVVKEEFYTLQGRLLDPMTIRTLKTGSVVLQRTIFKDNTSKMNTHVIMK